MKIKIQLMVMLFLGLSFYGCASGPGFTEYSEQIPKLNPEQGRVYVYRPGTFGAAVQPTVKIDNEVVGVAAAKGFFYADIIPGEHELSVTTETTDKLNFSIEKGETKYIRLDMRIGVFVGHMRATLVDYAQGLNEVSKTNYKGLESEAK